MAIWFGNGQSYVFGKMINRYRPDIIESLEGSDRVGFNLPFQFIKTSFGYLIRRVKNRRYFLLVVEDLQSGGLAFVPVKNYLLSRSPIEKTI
jgi:hypothetical protein